MDIALLVLYLVVGALRVSVDRSRRGPLRPSWPWRYEVLVFAQKAFSARVARRSLQGERRAWSAMKAVGPSLRRVSMTSHRLAGVEHVWFTPAQPARDAAERVILYLHGGAFAYGSQRSHGELVAELALAAQARALFPLYRLAPEHPFPAALEDATEAYRSLLASGIAASSIVIAGDSAGGNLALSLLLGLRDRGEPRPAAAVLISPWVDLTARGGSLERHQPFDWAEPWIFERWATSYLGSTPASAPYVSPGLAPLHDLPPLLVVIGSAEMLYDQVVALVDAARDAGTETRLDTTPDMAHLWMSLSPWFPAFGAVTQRMGDFIRAHAPVRSAR
jgi:acetyl esterase/lipase